MTPENKFAMGLIAVFLMYFVFYCSYYKSAKEIIKNYKENHQQSDDFDLIREYYNEQSTIAERCTFKAIESDKNGNDSLFMVYRDSAYCALYCTKSIMRKLKSIKK